MTNPESMHTPNRFHVGDRVRKTGGSYEATGTIQAVFATRAGLLRYVFEFDTPPGLLHIFNGIQLEAIRP